MAVEVGCINFVGVDQPVYARLLEKGIIYVILILKVMQTAEKSVTADKAK